MQIPANRPFESDAAGAACFSRSVRIADANPLPHTYRTAAPTHIRR
jgi:hypothetical protein